MDRRLLRAPAAILAIALPISMAGCGAAGGPSTSPSPSPGTTPVVSPPPSPSPGAVLDPAERKLRLLAAFGSLWYCDPDEYPVAREDEAALAAERLPEVRADAEAWAAITAALGFDAAAASFAPDRQLAIYRLWKVLNAIELTPTGDGDAFDELFGPKDAAGRTGEHVTGAIGPDGTVRVTTREAAGPPMCPICLARGTMILGPAGATPVEGLRVGAVVWTLDGAGRRVPGVVRAVASTPVPDGHRVVHLVLADGRSVTASPRHPLADGRQLGGMRVGDLVDGSRVVTADLVAYGGGRTFDLVVSGPTGVYLAGDGIALASTIDR